MKRCLFFAIPFFLFCIFGSEISGAQSCVFEVPLHQREVDGIAMDINPGDTICLTAGNREEIRFTNLSGTKDQPIVIINKGEKVVINTQAAKAIYFGNSVYFRLTGTGGADEYGIEIASGGIMGVEVSEFSSDAEIDHLEIHGVGFAGIMAKTDPSCSRKDLRYFTMKNLSFHDNYIYNTGGEGFYVGYSWYPSRETTCDEGPAIFYPHPIHGVRIYNNIIENTQWDGLQVGSSPLDVKIFGNTIRNYGLANEQYQNHAVQIGSGTTGDFFNNLVDTGAGGGISFFGIGNNNLYNNILINTGEQAIYQNDKGARPGSYYRIVNNTIIQPEGAGIWLNATTTKNNLVANNLIVHEKASAAIVNSTTHWINENNLVFKSLEEVQFKDPENFDFSLLAGSSAIDAGRAVGWLLFDYALMARPANGQMDVGAFEYGAEPYDQPVLGLKDKLSAKGFSVYPNPIGDSIFIHVPDHFSQNKVRLTLFNGEGKTVFTAPTFLNSGRSSLEIKKYHLSSGVYFLYLELEDGTSELFRIVKK